MMPFRLLMLSAVLLLAACATNYAERTQAQLQRYEAAAGEPVNSFRYFTFNSWSALGKEHVAVWTRPNEAWLLKLRPICPDLEFAQRIALTSSLSRVYARFDKVLVGDFECRIESIRPVDVKLLKDLQREARTTIDARDSGEPPSER